MDDRWFDFAVWLVGLAGIALVCWLVNYLDTPRCPGCRRRWNVEHEHESEYVCRRCRKWWVVK